MRWLSQWIPFWLQFFLAPGLVILLAAIAGAVLVRIGVALARRKPERYWRRFFRALLIAAPFCLLAAGPLTIGYFVARSHHTRDDESWYSGPAIDGNGDWAVAERLGRGERPQAPPAEKNRFEVAITSGDGVRLRGFLVPPRDAKPRAAVLLAHGLFRGALEIERPGAMLRDLGATVLLLELRNHGGSGTLRCTFGRDEALDVIAGAEFLRAQRGVEGLPIVLFGVSLGAGAIAMASPRVSPPPAGIVLDSPLATLSGAAEHQLVERVGMPQPFRFFTLLGVQAMGGVWFDSVRPDRELGRLDPRVQALVIGGERDELMPPEVVHRVFDALGERKKELWIVAEAEHGKAWFKDPDGYRARLSRLLDAVAP